MARIHSIAMITRIASHVSIRSSPAHLEKVRRWAERLSQMDLFERGSGGMDTEKESWKRESRCITACPSTCLGGKKSPVLIDLLFAGMPLPPYCSNLIMLLTDVADTGSPFWIWIV